MLSFFRIDHQLIYSVLHHQLLLPVEIEKISILFGGGVLLNDSELKGNFIGPRPEMVTPWSTNVVEILNNCGIVNVYRVEQLIEISESYQIAFDPMLQAKLSVINESTFKPNNDPEPIKPVFNIAAYNRNEGLALSQEEIEYLEKISDEIGRPLTDSEVFGFSQVNSEHCRHKIFNGTFVINGEEMPKSLFQLIKSTSKTNPNFIVSAYSDNVAFIEGPKVAHFHPKKPDVPSEFVISEWKTAISLKAETHNFPTTVEPFNGAATGTGGEIRDRLAGGIGSFPVAGTAVYMTPYSRLDPTRLTDSAFPERKWKYQTPSQILIKASNGASDFGNKFGQPLICGSLLTFEHLEAGQWYGYDKVVMLAGGVGFANIEHTQKRNPKPGDPIVLLGGDNYRIGMGGGAVSSVNTGEFSNSLELNAVQRSNPEMQKRAANVIRALCEAGNNPIISVHDHGAGGHMNCLSELVETTGGTYNIDELPIGDPTLSDKEILGNESQERMGLVVEPESLNLIERIAQRERSPYYKIGQCTDDKKLVFTHKKNGNTAFDIKLEHLFGSTPKVILSDETKSITFSEKPTDQKFVYEYLKQILMMESVGCKDWLTNKVDRSVTGKVAKQQTCGPLQLPLNNVAVVAAGYNTHKGIATSIGHCPIAGLINSGAGAKLSVIEALTNLVFAPLTHHLKGVSLSANWMWPAKNIGENARLYEAVQQISNFCIELGINIPTGKDSMSMTQKYSEGQLVKSPGTVIISTVAEVSDINKVIEPVNTCNPESSIIYIPFVGGKFELGGSAFNQMLGSVGNNTITDIEPKKSALAFELIQNLIENGFVQSGHDVGSGGLLVTLLEMLFASPKAGMNIDLNLLSNGEVNLLNILFSERPAVVLECVCTVPVIEMLNESGAEFIIIGNNITERKLVVDYQEEEYIFEPDILRDYWFKPSYLFEKLQTNLTQAEERFRNYKKQPLIYSIPDYKANRVVGSHKPVAAIIREKGVNGDREMAFSLFRAGFEVRDVHMTDLAWGRENLSDVEFVVFVGGFSNSDALGSARGWAGAFMYNPLAKAALDGFVNRPNTLLLGVCNGCQLAMELNLIYPEANNNHPKTKHNQSGKFESIFLTVDVPKSPAVMFKGLEGSRLGIWVAHGEGRFDLNQYDGVIPALQYSYNDYPGNPNGSPNRLAGMVSADGRRLAMMPHLERSVFPYQWPYKTKEMIGNEETIWMEAFFNARNWILEIKS